MHRYLSSVGSCSSKHFLSLAFLFYCLLSPPACLAQTPVFEWAGQFEGGGGAFAYSLVIDREGNSYTTGIFDGIVDFDPGPGVFNLQSMGASDFFVSKLDAAGNFVWVKQIGSLCDEQESAITMDASGNFYVAGRLCDSADVDPGPGVVFCDTFFICKFDSSWNFLWAKSLGNIILPMREGLKHDGADHLYLIGSFPDTVDFDPGPGVYNLVSDNVWPSTFILSLDNNGNFQWAKSLGPIVNIHHEGIALDSSNVYITGYSSDTVDFDPGPGVTNVTVPAGSNNAYVLKLDRSGNFIWVKSWGRFGHCTMSAQAIELDGDGSIYTTGWLTGSCDFDPGAGVVQVWPEGIQDLWVSKLDSNGNFLWGKTVPGGSYNRGVGLATDAARNVYILSRFQGSPIDFDPGHGVYNLTGPIGTYDMALMKLNKNGHFLWAGSIGAHYNLWEFNTMEIDDRSNLYISSSFQGTGDFDPSADSAILTASSPGNVFITRYRNWRILGHVYNDVDANCVRNNYEPYAKRIRGIINPGGLIVQTDANYWAIDSLAAGNYSITFDTSGKWQPTCPNPLSFTVVADSQVVAPDFGMFNTEPCAAPDVSVFAPLLRRCFINQFIYVQACNRPGATGALDSAYVVLKLDPLLAATSASIPVTGLGNNAFRFNLGTLNPTQCVDFWVNTTVSCNATLGRTLCIRADLYPVANCMLDTFPAPAPPDFSPCSLPYDGSHVSVRGWCASDTITFVITNNGTPGIGDMTCYSPVRLYIDGQYILLDSVMLAGGESDTMRFAGDGRTWRLEVDQHPRHPGESYPEATVELCGNVANWTPGLVTILPQDDADPVTDIYCGIVTASYDPNDKTGYPLGVGASHSISPNGQLQYVIRFQNTGNDTAFTVVLRDTLDEDFEIFSVTPGVASHDYEFTMYGHRILQWTFYDILLPDSGANETGSHGFATFTVDQNANLPDGTHITNSAGIYFDYNDPVITNTTQHEVTRNVNGQKWVEQIVVSDTACERLTYNGFTYLRSGSYFQIKSGGGSADSLVVISVTVHPATASTLTATSCDSYTLNAQTYDSSGVYLQHLVNSHGCDSLLTLRLTVHRVDNSVVQINEVLTAVANGASYQWINCEGTTILAGENNQSFTATDNGNYAVIVAANNCSDTSSCIEVINLSVPDLADYALLIYPNPAGEVFTISVAGIEFPRFEISDTKGAVILSGKAQNNPFLVDLSPFERGLYFLRIDHHVIKLIRQ